MDTNKINICNSKKNLTFWKKKQKEFREKFIALAPLLA